MGPSNNLEKEITPQMTQKRHRVRCSLFGVLCLLRIAVNGKKEVIDAMQLNRKGQGMLEYIIVVGAIMIIVVAFASTRITPSTSGVLNTATGAMGTAADNIKNVVPP